ncbi:hypothetical protein ACVR0S_07780 [Streptococcus dentapri]|uniref:Uncharacterized protein n=1 Tax=Streptococcus dentapri TaxID=573564 RepID=A0ABV8CZW3_9STRE
MKSLCGIIIFQAKSPLAQILVGFSSASKNSSTMAYSTDHYYDFNATLRLREMDTKGAVGYVAQTQGISEAEARKTIKETLKAKADDEVIRYLAGDPSVQLSDLDATQINDMEEYLDELSQPGQKMSAEGYRNYLEDTYEYKYE